MKHFGSFRLDTLNHCVWRGSARVELTPRAFDLLRYLVEHPGRVIGQDEILEALWPDTYVNPEVIKKHILSIRRALDDRAEHPTFIETIPRRGYRFAAEITDQFHGRSQEAAFSSSQNIVGRDEALTELDQCLAKAREGRRGLVFISGEAGIGKTTLVDLFCQSFSAQSHTRIARGQCVEGFGGKEPYYPVLDGLGQLSRGRDSDSLVQVLAKHAPTWLVQYPALVKPEQFESLQREILGATRERMVREICEALEVLSSDELLIVVLEDLHWVDTSTLDLVSALARRREPAKLLMLCTYRPTDAAAFESPLKSLKQDLLVHDLCREIALEQLSEVDVEEYLRNEFSGSVTPMGLAGLIHRQSGGNALFMTAMVQELVKKGYIAEEDGQWKLSVPLHEVDPGVPETLQQMLELQFDRLPPEEQSILRSASVFGDRFSAWAITPALSSSVNEIEDRCDSLAQREQFIRFAGIQELGDGEVFAQYEFRHALYRDTVYRGLSDVVRSKLHRLSGERLKILCTDGRQELASEVAFHFVQGHNHDQAIRYLVIAAVNASKRFAYRDSIRILQQALELFDRTRSTHLVETELQILQLIGDFQYWLGEMSESAHTYEKQVARAAQSGLKAEEINAMGRLVLPLGFLDPDHGISIAEEAVSLSSETNDPVLVALSQMLAAGYRCVYGTWSDKDWDIWMKASGTISHLSDGCLPLNHHHLYLYLLLLRGEYQEALQHIEMQSSSPINDTASLMRYVFSTSAQTVVLLRLGRLGELLKLARDGQELAAKNGNDPWLFNFREAWLRTLVFDFEGALQLCDKVTSADSTYPTAQPRTIARMARGYTELDRGHYDRAVECFSQVIDKKRTAKFFLHWFWRMIAEFGVSEVGLSSKNLAVARSRADGFLESALTTADPYLHGLAWELQTRVAIAEHSWDRAKDAIRKALNIVERFEIPMIEWRVRSTAWDLYRETGRKETAHEHHQRAASCIFRIANSFPQDEPLREIFLKAEQVNRIIRGTTAEQVNALGIG